MRSPVRASTLPNYYEAPGNVAQTLAFYSDKLKAAGWAQEPRETVDEIGHLVITGFDKDGFHLNLQINKGDKRNRVSIHLENKGNIDVRGFPRLTDAVEPSLEGFDDLLYDTQTKPDAAVEFYRRELVQRGWKEYAPERKEYADGSKSFVFEQNAMFLTLRFDRESVRIESVLLGERIPPPPSKK